MINKTVKQRLINFVNWHILQQVDALANEQIFQQIFAQQCANWNVRNDFYPVGGAAGYTLMYLLFRIITEHRIESVAEFGSGQSTILIDRLRAGIGRHVCYEDDPSWHASISVKLKRCDYRLRPLAQRVISGVGCRTYSEVDVSDFDLMLVDGPKGVEEFSRFGCVDAIVANQRNDFVIIFDDSERPGERQTIEFVERLLKERSIGYRRRDLRGRTGQAVLATGSFESVLYYW